MDTPVNPTPLSADEIRHRMMEQFQQFEKHMEAYHEYAGRMAALSLEYHNIRLKEVFPSVPVEEGTQVCVLDTRQTPKTLDAALAQLHEIPVKRIVFDRVKSTYTLFT